MTTISKRLDRRYIHVLQLQAGHKDVRTQALQGTRLSHKELAWRLLVLACREVDSGEHFPWKVGEPGIASPHRRTGSRQKLIRLSE